MYVRKISRRRKDGSRVRYLQLAHRYATPRPGPPVMRSSTTSAEDELDRARLQRLIRVLLRERSYRADVERVLFALVASRAPAPRSKLAVERWVDRHVAAEGLEEVAVHTVYRAMDFLIEHAEEIQRAVFFSTATLLNLKVDLLFFDTTGLHLRGMGVETLQVVVLPGRAQPATADDPRGEDDEAPSARHPRLPAQPANERVQ